MITMKMAFAVISDNAPEMDRTSEADPANINFIECDRSVRGQADMKLRLMLDVSLKPAAEQRPELSPRRGFASLGSTTSKLIEPRRGDRKVRNPNPTDY